MATDEIERLRQKLRAALVGTELEAHADAVLAASEPYIVLESPELRRHTEQELAYIAQEYAQKRENEARRELRDVKLREREEQLPLGASRFGFVPDLPPGVDWPVFEDKKYLFLAQIDLSAMPRWDGSLLPTEGWLYAFAMFPGDRSTPERPWCSVVFHHRGPREALTRAARPAADEVWTVGERDEGVEELLPLQGRIGIDVDRTKLSSDLPTWNLEDIIWKVSPRYSESSDETHDCGYLLGQLSDVDGNATQMVRDLMQYRTDAAAQRMADEGKDVSDAICLLTLYSAGSMQWSDAGVCYFLIRGRDLASGDFSRACMAITSG